MELIKPKKRGRYLSRGGRRDAILVIKHLGREVPAHSPYFKASGKGKVVVAASRVKGVPGSG